MKKILLISHSFPPLLTANSIQIGRWVEALADRFSFHVISVKEHMCNEQGGLAEIRNPSVTVQRLPSLERLFEKTRIAGVIRKIAPAFLAMPDPQVLWLPFASSTAGKRVLDSGADIIMSCSHYLSNHLAARMARRYSSYSRPMSWIAHFSDPWTDSIYFTPLSERHRRWCLRAEEVIVTEADLLSFPSAELRDLMLTKYMNKCPGILDKSVVIPHAYDPRLFSTTKETTGLPGNGTKLRFIHTGSFYGGRSPMPLLRSLGPIKKVLAEGEFLLVGAEPSLYARDIAALDLSGKVRCIPRVSYEQSLAYMLSADYLLLIDAPCEGEKSVFFPSKLADYLGTGIPILGITSPKSASARILRETGHTVLDIDEPAQISSTIERLLSREETIPRREAPPAYSIGHVADLWASLLEKAGSIHK